MEGKDKNMIEELADLLVSVPRAKTDSKERTLDESGEAYYVLEEFEDMGGFQMDYYESAVDGSYIGRGDDFCSLLEKGLVLIQKAAPTDNVASIAYCPKENKWYGWSHRAIYGFGIGDKVSEGDLTNSSGLIEEYRIQHPEEDYSLPVGFVAKNLNDAKRMAIAYAKAVS